MATLILTNFLRCIVCVSDIYLIGMKSMSDTHFLESLFEKVHSGSDPEFPFELV